MPEKHYLPRFPRLKRYFYYLFKEYFSLRTPGKPSWRYRIIMLQLVITLVTFPFAIYSMAHDYSLEIWRWEPLMRYFYTNRHLYDPYLILVIFIFELFSVYMNYCLYNLPTDGKLWRWYYEMFVLQQDRYYRCLIKDEAQLRSCHQKSRTRVIQRLQKLRIPSNNFISNSLITKLVELDVFVRLENLDKDRFFKRRLAVFPGLSVKFRSKAIVILLIADKLMVAFFIGYGNVYHVLNLLLIRVF